MSVTVRLPCCQVWRVLSGVHPEFSTDTQTLTAKSLRTGFFLPVSTCGKVALVQADALPERPEYNLLRSGKAERRMSAFNRQEHAALALREGGEEPRSLTIGGSRCSQQPGEAPGCMTHWEPVPRLADGDGAGLWVIGSSPSLAAAVAVR